MLPEPTFYGILVFNTVLSKVLHWQYFTKVSYNGNCDLDTLLGIESIHSGGLQIGAMAKFGD